MLIEVRDRIGKAVNQFGEVVELVHGPKKIFIDQVHVGYTEDKQTINLIGVVTDEVERELRKHFGDTATIIGPSVLMDRDGNFVRAEDVREDIETFDDTDEEEDDDE